MKYAGVAVYVAAHTMANDGMEGGELLLLHTEMVVCMKVHCLCCRPEMVVYKFGFDFGSKC